MNLQSPPITVKSVRCLDRIFSRPLGIPTRVLALALAVLGMAWASRIEAAQILFVHAPSGGAPTATDQALVNELTLGLGHKVKLRGVTSAADKPAASEGEAVDLVIVSESVSSGNVTDAFKTITKPVIVLEGFIADDMDLAAPGTVAGQQSEITNPDHPLAAGLSGAGGYL